MSNLYAKRNGSETPKLGSCDDPAFPFAAYELSSEICLVDLDVLWRTRLVNALQIMDV
jgi:hypothetical protein